MNAPGAVREALPAVSRRGREAPPSPIRKLEACARATERRGVRLFSLNIGQPDLSTAPGFLACARQEEGSVLAYGPSGGLYPLREAFAEYYRSLGLAVTEEDVLVTTGGSEAVFFALAAAADPGDEVLTPEPCYPNYRGFATLAGVTLAALPTSIESGFALPSPEAFEAAITPRTRAVVVCNPSNPTGAVYPAAALRSLVEIARRRGLFVIADEVYREFVYDGLRPASLLEIPGAEEVTVVVDSTSKRLSACGARVGALVTRHPALRDAVMRFAQARLSPPVLEQKGAIAALRGLAPFVRASVAEYERRRDVTLEELARIPGVVAPRPQGAFYLLARLPVRSSDEFCRWLLEEFEDGGETVMLAPGSGFYATPGRGEDEVRIAYVLGETPLRRALGLLGRGLERYPGRSGRL
jgi:aspartate aminotransferase